MALAGDGSILISDAMSGRVLQFARSGEPLRAFGRRGDGPGELRSLVTVAVAGDSLLLVADWQRQKISQYELATGAYGRAVDFTGLPFAMQVVRDTVWIAGLNRVAGTSAGVWPLTDDSCLDHDTGDLALRTA